MIFVRGWGILHYSAPSKSHTLDIVDEVRPSRHICCISVVLKDGINDQVEAPSSSFPS